jgi:hypothetical protein
MAEHPQKERIVKDPRTKIAIAAVIFGLGGLGGYAIASNPAQHGQLPAAKVASQSGSGTPRVSTGTSGAVSAPALSSPASQTLPRTTLLGAGGRDD